MKNIAGILGQNKVDLFFLLFHLCSFPCFKSTIFVHCSSIIFWNNFLTIAITWPWFRRGKILRTNSYLSYSCTMTFKNILRGSLLVLFRFPRHPILFCKPVFSGCIGFYFVCIYGKNNNVKPLTAYIWNLSSFVSLIVKTQPASNAHCIRSRWWVCANPLSDLKCSQTYWNCCFKWQRYKAVYKLLFFIVIFL